MMKIFHCAYDSEYLGQKHNLTHEELYNESWAVWIPYEIRRP